MKSNHDVPGTPFNVLTFYVAQSSVKRPLIIVVNASILRMERASSTSITNISQTQHMMVSWRLTACHVRTLGATSGPMCGAARLLVDAIRR